jgi:hypothetical protein
MLNTWLTDIIRTTNESIFSDADLSRIMAYYASMPSRLKLCEELERLEPTLVKSLHGDLVKRYPNRPLYSRRFVQDLIESLRIINRAVLTDDLRLLRYRWIDHLQDLAAATNLDLQEVREAYLVLRDLLHRTLPRSAWSVLEPAYEELLDALTRGPALVN